MPSPADDARPETGLNEMAGAPVAARSHHPSGKACVECGATLDVHEAARGGVCSRPECARRQAAREAEDRRLREQRQADLERARAATVAAEFVRNAAVPGLARHAAYAVPDNTRRLVPADPGRIADFTAHLDSLLSAIAAHPVTAEPDADEDPAPSPGDEGEDPHAALTAPPPLIEVLACTTCRGKCCVAGGSHAFLDESVLRRWFARHPDASAEDCRAAYLGPLGAPSYEDACVYQGERGCRLDRDMRADTCNRFRCHSLVDLGRRQANEPAPTGALVAFEAGRATRIRLVDTVGGRDLGEHELPA